MNDICTLFPIGWVLLGGNVVGGVAVLCLCLRYSSHVSEDARAGGGGGSIMGGDHPRLVQTVVAGRMFPIGLIQRLDHSGF